MRSGIRAHFSDTRMRNETRTQLDFVARETHLLRHGHISQRPLACHRQHFH